MKKYILFTIGILVIIISGASILVQQKKSAPEPQLVKEQQTVIPGHYSVRAVEIPENLNFAGEEVPLDIFYVKESLDKELTVNTYWHSSTMLLMKRANRYFSIIEPILKEQAVPDDFKYLALIESGFENVTSPAGAVGFWQFLKGTAKDFGLEVSTEVDERYHLEKATVAACKYLKDAHEDYGSWTMAAASYNAGKRGLNRQIVRQKENNYYDLLLSDETERYVFRILAVKTIFEDPEKYGFYMGNADLYPPINTYTVKVDSSVEDLADFAKEHGITYRMLKEFNPWLRQAYLKNPHRNEYHILIPKEGFSKK